MLPSTNQPNWIQYGTGLVVVVLLLGAFFGWFSPEIVPQNVPTALEIATATAGLIVLPEVKDSLDNEKLAAIHDKILEDDVWENEAEALATEEWSENDNKDLYRAIRNLYGDIDDEDDIIYVREDESTDFSSMDADDKDGVVTQYLKVKYEDEDGDDRKVYITVETEFDEGDLEDQDFSETE